MWFPNLLSQWPTPELKKTILKHATEYSTHVLYLALCCCLNTTLSTESTASAWHGQDKKEKEKTPQLKSCRPLNSTLEPDPISLKTTSTKFNIPQWSLRYWLLKEKLFEGPFRWPDECLATIEQIFMPCESSFDVSKARRAWYNSERGFDQGQNVSMIHVPMLIMTGPSNASSNSLHWWWIRKEGSHPYVQGSVWVSWYWHDVSHPGHLVQLTTTQEPCEILPFSLFSPEPYSRSSSDHVCSSLPVVEVNKLLYFLTPSSNGITLDNPLPYVHGSMVNQCPYKALLLPRSQILCGNNLSRTCESEQ